MFLTILKTLFILSAARDIGTVASPFFCYTSYHYVFVIFCLETAFFSKASVLWF